MAQTPGGGRTVDDPAKGQRQPQPNRGSGQQGAVSREQGLGGIAPFVPQATGGSYTISDPSFTGGRSYSASNVNDLLGTMLKHPLDLENTYKYLTGDPNKNEVNVMTDAIRGAFSGAGGAKANIFSLYKAGEYDMPTRSRKSSGGTGSGSVVGQGDGLSQMRASAQYSAFQTIDASLHEWGLENLSGWAWDQISAAGDNKSAAGVLKELRDTPEYQARFPGQAGRIAAGHAPMSESKYVAYEDAAQEVANQYELPQGFMSREEVGKLIGNNVSLQETQDRIINGFRLANNANPEVKDALKKFYGLHHGDLAAYYLDPKNSYNSLMKKTQAAEIGGIFEQTGVGMGGAGVAEYLAKDMLGSASSMSLGDIKQGAKQIAPEMGLQTQQVGMRGQATVNRKQLLGSAFDQLNKKFGTTAAQNQAAVSLAREARGAGLSGGGGFAQTSRGGVGIGSASTEGTGKP